VGLVPQKTADEARALSLALTRQVSEKRRQLVPRIGPLGVSIHPAGSNSAREPNRGKAINRKVFQKDEA